jgi:hypothetical protein
MHSRANLKNANFEVKACKKAKIFTKFQITPMNFL